MILVNNPGDWGAVYAPLLHAEWHGWTPTDLIFPFFLFIVGVVIPLALGGRLARGAGRGPLVARAARRALILIGLGLFISGFPFALFGPRSFERLLETWRFPGVLQRIGLCYFAASALFIRYWSGRDPERLRRAIKLWIAVLLLGYWMLMTLVPVPQLESSEWGPPDLASKSDHLAGWVDRAVFGSHVWVSAKVYDPEGLLSTIPAIATTLFGMLAGLWLAGKRASFEELSRLFVNGSLLVILGYCWGWVFPINKALWTSSYAVFTAGIATCALGLCYWFFDLEGRRAIARPFAIYGVNAITVFVGSAVLAKTLGYVEVGGRSLHALIYQSLFTSWLPPYVASLGYALAWIAGWFAVLAWMDRRGLYLKI
jgi:predicted acyltransferase